MAKSISNELTKYLETPVEINLDALNASDLVGCARAFGSLVKGGLSIEESAGVSRVLIKDK